MRRVMTGLSRMLDRWAMRRYRRAAQWEADQLRDGAQRLDDAREGRLRRPTGGGL